jgi:amino acid transporter
MSETASTDLPQPTVTDAPSPVRDFSLRSAFALAFSDVSPIVGIYSVLAISLVTAGPVFFWAFPIVLIGQLLVTGVFGELVSRWPFQGSVYAWARELIGPRYGWFAGWAYMWGLTLALSALSLAAAGFLLGAFGVGSPGYAATVFTALGVLIFGSAANMIGSRLLKTLLYVSMTCELIASLGIGVALLFFHRTHPFSFLFTSGGTGHGGHWLFSSFFGVVAFIGFSFLGFESAGSIAEEVREARRALPKAITLSLLVAGILVMFASLGIVLSIPDIGAVLTGHDANPIATTLETRLGSATGKVLLVMLTVGFTASLIGVQAAVTRAVWANARDRVLPAATILRRLSGREHLPRYAIGLTAIIAGALLFISSSNIYALLLSFGNAGFYISYALPVVAAAYLRWRGRWEPGEFTMGRWSSPATYIAAVWITLEAINIAWPRPLYGSWYLNWGLLIMTGILGVIGIIVSARVFRPGGPAAALTDRSAAERG